MKKQNLYYAGLAAIVIGCFGPAISLPIIGDISLFKNGEGDGVMILVLTLFSFVAYSRKSYSVAGFCLILAGCILGYDFLGFQEKMADMAAKLKGNPFAALATNSVKLGWGMPAIGFGVVSGVIGCLDAEKGEAGE